MKAFNLLIWLTQLGLSVAVPPTLCILAALYLRNRFGLGPWILIFGLVLGFTFAFQGFRTSLKAMEHASGERTDDRQAPPDSVNNHQ